MQSWVTQITTAATATVALCVVGHSVVAAEPGDAFDRAAMLAALSIDTSVPSPQRQAHTVGRAVALRALSQPMAIPDRIILQRLEIAAAGLPRRRQL